MDPDPVSRSQRGGAWIPNLSVASRGPRAARPYPGRCLPDSAADPGNGRTAPVVRPSFRRTPLRPGEDPRSYRPLQPSLAAEPSLVRAPRWAREFPHRGDGPAGRAPGARTAALLLERHIVHFPPRDGRRVSPPLLSLSPRVDGTPGVDLSPLPAYQRPVVAGLHELPDRRAAPLIARLLRAHDT